MNPSRDRWIAGGALVVLALMAAAVVALVLDAQRAGIETREDLRLEQVGQLANSMDARVQQAYGSLGATVGAPGAFRLVPGDPADSARLRPTSPQATSGSLLLDRDGTIVNGSLLRDEGSIGERYERDGIELALRGEPTLLGIGPGLTTADPVLGIAIPLRDDSGALAGVYVIESPVTADSAFSEEVAQLRAGETGVFSFVDATGTVAASSAEATLAQQFDLPAAARTPGFRRLDGRVTATADVPSARWQLVFQQTTDEFEGDLTGPLRTALLIVVGLAVVGGGVSVVVLLRRLRASREEQRRLAEISAAREEFTSIVSHELRTPVAGLLGFLQTTSDHWDVMTEDERRRAVARAQQNAERLQHLTAEVLDTTTFESGDASFATEVADGRDLVAQAVDIARDANPGRTIELHQPDEPLPVDVDPARIRQVVTNLLDNALKSSPLDAPVEVAVRPQGGRLVVAVSDHGPGIAVADRERIFDKFTRARTGATRGSGLGLYLSREIVTAHGGTIAVDGEAAGPGATVVFELPLVNERPRA